MDVVIDSTRSLDELRAGAGRSSAQRIRLAGPLEDAVAERALNRAYFACGCQAGSFAVVATLVGSVVLGLVLGFDGPLAWWWIVLYLAAASVLGKAIGLGAARLQLRRLYRELRSRALQAEEDRSRRTPAPGESGVA